MYVNDFKLKGGPSHAARSDRFIRSVEVKEGARKSVAVFDRLLILFWGLMLTKCILATIAVGYWDMPISSFWVWLPSLIFGAVCTFLYLSRE